jgi:ATP-dependent Lhr-like helicase
MIDIFTRLAPFIREYIYAHEWTELRAVQIEACHAIFETDSHLLLSTGTASGKTEAAFLPILTLLEEKPSKSIGVLYIGPIKALINDQFVRLADLLKEARIPVWHWHGDVSQAEKSRLIKNPSGVLQITPESIESLLLNRASQLDRLFCDLRFIVIDEIHVFMGSDRGRQILCQLKRISKYTESQPRRIGLSATLGDYSYAEDWLRSGTDKTVLTPSISAGQQRMRLAVEHFWEQIQNDKSSEPSGDAVSTPGEDYYEYIHKLSKGKCLIFANSRSETEAVVANLRFLAERAREPDIYHVHHGSISATLREAAENAMRDPERAAVTAATVSLELGIDIGQLERVLQLDGPFSVSSFLQRLGRSGRRGQPSQMIVICSEQALVGNEIFPKQIPWSLLRAIAIIQLYLEERWIEPLIPPQYPFSLLYHQTMSVLASSGELSPSALAERVLTLPPFKNISQNDFRDLLLHLISIDHIQRTDEGGLIIGLEGEKIVSNFHFYAVFADRPEFTVYHDAQAIGTVTWIPPIGERFGLAGRTWEVMNVDPKRMVVNAKPVKGRVEAHWSGSGGNIHGRILLRMRRALTENTVYPYLQSGAVRRLEEARNLARSANLQDRIIVPLSENVCCVFPWMGSSPAVTLTRTLKYMFGDQHGITAIEATLPYFMLITTQQVEKVEELLSGIAKDNIDPAILVSPDETPQLEKYDEFVPASLLRKAFAADGLDVSGMQQYLKMNLA